MADWYFEKNGRSRGPVSWARLRQMAASGQIGPHDLVLREGGAEWAEASAVAGLFPAPAPEPSPRPDRRGRGEEALDELPAELVSGPNAARRGPAGEPASGLEQALRNRGAWAGALTYLLSAVCLFCLVVSMASWAGRRDPGGEMPERIQRGIITGLVLSLVPGGLAWLLVDSVQAARSWWQAPRPTRGGPDLRPRLGWLAGPVRLLAIVGCLLLGATLGAALALAFPEGAQPAEAAGIGLVVGLFLGGLVALLLAFLITLVVWSV